MTKLKIAYFGSPNFSADFLEKLITDTTINRLIEVVFVVTQPDRPVGRKQIMTPTPVKQIAKKNRLEILEIENCKFKKDCKLKILNLDFCLVYAFSQKIPKELLDLPRLGFINIHPSLLPKYRGPSPIAAPLINGDKKTGVTIIKMDEVIDHGPIISQEELAILPQDRRPDLEKKLTTLAFEMFNKLVKSEGSFFEPIAWAPLDEVGKKHGIKPFTPQNHAQATYTKLLKKQDGFVEFKNLKLKIKTSPKELFNLFRGLYPWPGLWTQVTPPGWNSAHPKRLKITDIQPPTTYYQPLVIKRVQLEGKREVDFTTFQKAYKLF